MTGLAPFDAFDAYLVTGGLPLVAQEWAHGATLTDFLTASFSTSTSALVVAGSRALDTELPEASFPRQVLTAIGGRGELTFAPCGWDRPCSATLYGPVPSPPGLHLHDLRPSSCSELDV